MRITFLALAVVASLSGCSKSILYKGGAPSSGHAHWSETE